MSSHADVTRLLLDWRRGDRSAEERLVAELYDDLREVARGRLRGERNAHTLQPTALVHEAYLRLMGIRRIDWQDRGHFLAVAARVMGQVLVDHARRRRAAKRGGGEGLTLLPGDLAESPPPVDLLGLSSRDGRRSPAGGRGAGG